MTTREELVERLAEALDEVDSASLSPDNLRVEAAYIIDRLGLTVAPPPSPSREEAVRGLLPFMGDWTFLVIDMFEERTGEHDLAEEMRDDLRKGWVPLVSKALPHILRTLGLVAASPSRDIYTVEVPRALVERVRTARTLIVDANNKCVRCAGPPTIFYEYLDGPCRTGCATCERVAAGELADAVLSQLGAKMTT